LRAIGWLLRVFAYIFHTLLSLALVAVGGVAILSGGGTLKIEMLPWQGPMLATWMVCLGAIGLLSVAIAVLGRFRILFTLWAFVVLALLVRGVFFAAGVTFSGPDDFHDALWMLAGALLAFLGSLTRPPRRAV
jgi:hypothetical protein